MDRFHARRTAVEVRKQLRRTGPLGLLHRDQWTLRQRSAEASGGTAAGEARHMSSIVGLCGSLREASLNRMLLRAAVELAPPGVSIEPESIREIPLYDGDVEDQQGLPSAVQRLKDRIAD